MSIIFLNITTNRKPLNYQIIGLLIETKRRRFTTLRFEYYKEYSGFIQLELTVLNKLVIDKEYYKGPLPF